MEDKYQALKEIVKRDLSYAAHDLDHVLRVHDLCLRLANEQGHVNLEILVPAALLHDIARRQEDEDPTGQIDHAVLGAKMAEKILQSLNYNPILIPKIEKCIRSHRFRSGSIPETLEEKILFDADKLDVIGAIGIARSYMLAWEHGERMYRNIPVEVYVKENVGENGRIKDVSKHSTNLEFELKLKKIPEKLFTEKARIIALSRIEYMETFFKRLKDETAGNS